MYVAGSTGLITERRLTLSRPDRDNHVTSVGVGAPFTLFGTLQLFGILRGGRFQFAASLLHAEKRRSTRYPS
jgi:hypothetical protein